jgi:hypothetical protein
MAEPTALASARDAADERVWFGQEGVDAVAVAELATNLDLIRAAGGRPHLHDA